MVSSSLTERLVADATELTRSAYQPSVCPWFPACSIPATAWRCGCIAKVGARSDQQAAEQQQKALVGGLARGLAQARARHQQDLIPGAPQETSSPSPAPAQTPQLAVIARCLKNLNHICHSCYFCSACRCPSSTYFFLSIQTRGLVLSTCRFFNTTWLQATILRRIGSAVCTAVHRRVCMSCIIYQYKKPISSNPSTVSAWRSVPITTGTIITRRLSVGTPTRPLSRLAYIGLASPLESLA